MERTERRWGALVNGGIALSALLLALLLVEAALRAGALDRPDDPRPVWIPPRFKEINAEINSRKRGINEKNFFPFTDIVRSQRKRPGHARIAVLGDSFIWGDGLEEDDIWSRKLERMVAESHPGIEVASWGISGWSTATQGWFLGSFGAAFRPDYLIVGFVTNDPDFGTVERKEFLWQKSSPYEAFRRLFPLTADCFAKHLNRLLGRHFHPDHTYEWWEDRLYSGENLELYGRLLSDLSRFCRDRGIPLLFVLTPQSTAPEIREKFDKVIPLLRRAGIDYLDLHPAMVRRFGGEYPRKLWANPANGHPGPPATELFATEVHEYLRFRGVLPELLRRARARGGDEPTGVRRASPAPSETILRLRRVNDDPAPGVERLRVGANLRDRYLFLEGDAVDAASGGPAGGVYLEVDGRIRLPAYCGPTYSLVRPSLRNDEFEQVPGTENDFKIHVPLAEVGTGTHTLNFLVLSEDGGAGWRPAKTILLDVR